MESYARKSLRLALKFSAAILLGVSFAKADEIPQPIGLKMNSNVARTAEGDNVEPVFPRIPKMVVIFMCGVLAVLALKAFGLNDGSFSHLVGNVFSRVDFFFLKFPSLLVILAPQILMPLRGLVHSLPCSIALFYVLSSPVCAAPILPLFCLAKFYSSAPVCLFRLCCLAVSPVIFAQSFPIRIYPLSKPAAFLLFNAVSSGSNFPLGASSVVLVCKVVSMPPLFGGELYAQV